MEEYKFKRWDKVRILSNSHNIEENTGIIIRINSSKHDDKCCYLVCYYEEENSVWHSEDELELLIEEPCRYSRRKITDCPEWFEYGYAYDCHVWNGTYKQGDILPVIGVKPNGMFIAINREGNMQSFVYANPILKESKMVKLEVPEEILDRVQELIEEAKRG